MPADPLLLTPGPLTTSRATKEAMLKDWGSRDPAFIALVARVRERLAALANGGADYVCVPVQGSGTFGVEATLGTLIPRGGRAAVLANGAYGRRILRILEVAGRVGVAVEDPEDRPSDVARLDALLAGDPSLRHVCVVHCETTSGVLNPLAEVARVARAHGRGLIVDAMSSFGALPVDARALGADAVIASSNKCLEGAPGVAFAILRKAALAGCAGNAHSLSLDLHDQWRGFEANAQWRFTPPTHVLAALDAALDQHAAEGGVAGRGARYAENCRTLVAGLRRLGFRMLLPDAIQAPIIVTVHMPADPRFDFRRFYDRLAEQGFVIYPGKLTVADSFRIGCIGQVTPADIRGALAAMERALGEMGVTDCAPKLAA